MNSKIRSRNAGVIVAHGSQCSIMSVNLLQAFDSTYT